ncbi:DUF6282 family protein [soil metagenome]
MQFDLHVHSGPCAAPRLADDPTTVALCERAGMAGCVLKAHCEPTVGRAAGAGSGRAITVLGGVVLNHPVGGLNPAAVATALELGGRVVWMPTVDARAHRRSGLANPPPCHRSGPAGRPLAVPHVDGDAEPAVQQICRLVADADAVLATGHLGPDEVGWLVGAARRAGVRRVLLTHPFFSVPGLGPGQARELAEQGAYAELTAFQLLHQPGMTAARLADVVRAVGERRCVLSSDAGQPDSPPPPEALELLVEALGAQGLDRGALRAMASEIPADLVLADRVPGGR